MLQSIGMTGKQLKRMLSFEGLYYAVGTIITSAVLGVLFSVAVVRGISSGFFSGENACQDGVDKVCDADNSDDDTQRPADGDDKGSTGEQLKRMLSFEGLYYALGTIITSAVPVISASVSSFTSKGKLTRWGLSHSGRKISVGR